MKKPNSHGNKYSIIKVSAMMRMLMRKINMLGRWESVPYLKNTADIAVTYRRDKTMQVIKA